MNKILKNLSSSKCSAVDGLDNFILEIAADIITDPMVHIINISLMQEKFPEAWKQAKIIPLHKKDDTWEPKNYRPVSIISPLSKVLENVIHKQFKRRCNTESLKNRSVGQH